MENLVTLTYDSTHYFLIDCLIGKFLIDAGLAGSLPKFMAQLKANKVAASEIKYVMMTHHHPDHAGILQEIRNLTGAKLVILEKQVPFLEELRKFYEKKGGYTPLQVNKNDLVLKAGHQGKLREIGIHGEIIETPGHSDDSVSLVLDSGKAFIGDMNPLYAADGESDPIYHASWKKLIDMNVQMFYPSHADPFPASRIRIYFNQ